MTNVLWFNFNLGSVYAHFRCFTFYINQSLRGMPAGQTVSSVRFGIFFFVVASNLRINLFIKLCSLLEGSVVLIVFNKNGPITKGRTLLPHGLNIREEIYQLFSFYYFLFFVNIAISFASYFILSITLVLRSSAIAQIFDI